jgi:hypothetical protein
MPQQICSEHLRKVTVPVTQKFRFPARCLRTLLFCAPHNHASRCMFSYIRYKKAVRNAPARLRRNPHAEDAQVWMCPRALYSGHDIRGSVRYRRNVLWPLHFLSFPPTSTPLRLSRNRSAHFATGKSVRRLRPVSCSALPLRGYKISQMLIYPGLFGQMIRFLTLDTRSSYVFLKNQPRAPRSRRNIRQGKR